MIICTGDLDDSSFSKQADWLEGQLKEVGAEIFKADRWGRRRFAYEIDHKLEGYYAVYELLAEGGALDPVERNMRLSDNFVRHKLMRLPEFEAERRGMYGGPTPEETRAAKEAERQAAQADEAGESEAAEASVPADDAIDSDEATE